MWLRKAYAGLIIHITVNQPVAFVKVLDINLHHLHIVHTSKSHLQKHRLSPVSIGQPLIELID